MLIDCTCALPARLRPGGRLLNADHCVAAHSRGSGLLSPAQPLVPQMVPLASLIRAMHSVSAA